MSRIKIGYFADGPWSHNAFELMIRDQNIEICFIVPRKDTNDGVLKGFSEKYNIPYYTGVDINSDSFYELSKQYACDLFVSMSFNQIFRSRITNQPRLGSINCHAGKLPFYRGRNILNWVLINDEKEFGITVHKIDDGIDTGDIILQRTYPINDTDDYHSLLNVAYIECARILHDAVVKLYDTEVVPVKQETIHPVGFYCGIRGPGDEVIDWKQSSRTVFNFIRAVCAPGPMAYTTCKGLPVKINKAQLIQNAPTYVSTPGQIVGKTSVGYVVKTIDSTILISEISTDARLRVGDRFE